MNSMHKGIRLKMETAQATQKAMPKKKVKRDGASVDIDDVADELV